MEKGADKVLDRKTSSNSDCVGWTKGSGSKISMSMMAAHHHQITNPYYTLGVGDDDGGGSGANEAAVFDYYKTPAGGGMAFTAAQWKELERQAMIYKCMISSVPVPPHLLFPLPLALDSPFPNFYGGKKGDPEPGRCKRTDGKKWRCSREVAPQQKYCERHLHRGRPRSRKPVEPKKTRLSKTIPYSSKQPWEDNLFSYPQITDARDVSFAQGGPLAEALHLAFPRHHAL